MGVIVSAHDCLLVEQASGNDEVEHSNQQARRCRQEAVIKLVARADVHGNSGIGEKT